MATTFPDVTQGDTYSVFVQHYGGRPPYSWVISAGALPLGLALTANGFVSGTVNAAAAPGVYNFTVQVTDGLGRVASKAFSVTVLELSNYLWIAQGASAAKRYSDPAFVDGGAVDTESANGVGILYDGTYLWTMSDANPAQIERYNPSTRVRSAGPFALGRVNAGYDVSQPLCFDGANYWCATNAATVQKFAADGTNLGTVGIGGSSSQWVAWDGGDYILVPHAANSDIARVHKTTHAVAVTGGLGFPTNCPGIGPIYGGYIYQPVLFQASGNGNICKIRISDMTKMWNNYTGIRIIHHVVTDGTNLFALFDPNNDGVNETFAKLSMADGSLVTSYVCPGNCKALYYDGTYIWLTSIGNSRVYRFDIAAGTFTDFAAALNNYGICATTHLLPYPV